MKNLIVVGHPDVESFCYNGIFKTVKEGIEKSKQEDAAKLAFVLEHIKENNLEPQLIKL